LRCVVVVLVLEPLLFAQEARPYADADVLYLEANGHFNRGHYAQAIERYNAFLLKFPDHSKRVNVRYGLGLSLFQLKKYREAGENLNIVAAKKQCPDRPRANYFLGQSLMATGKYAEADKVLGNGIKALSNVLTVPKDKAVFQKLEQSLKVSRLGALVHLRNWEDVVKESDDLKGKAGTHAFQVSFQGALARYELKQFKEVLPLLSALKKDAKDTPYEQQSHFLLAEALRELEKVPEALEEYEAAAKIR
ncbi:uncharacterized protein METZ01_LOCUS466396, partial [marine metagenome]